MISAIIFDKDGTLFDFTASWGAWVHGFLDAVATSPNHRADLAQALQYDLVSKRFSKTSPVIAKTTPEIAQVVAPLLPNLSFDALISVMNTQAQGAMMQPAVDLPRVLGALRARGLRLGVATNDTQAPAYAHLAAAGVLDLFDFVAGCDSGWGGKPAPGQLLAFAAHLGIDPRHAAMVGDSTHDLHAARAAGMAAVAVLTGVALADELAPHADVVLDDISGIDAWLDQISRENDI
jgi:phosphoglycolate phosphatase